MQYHILRQNLNDKTIEVVYHYPVPTGNNAAGKPWQECVLEVVMQAKAVTVADDITSVLPSISTAELASMKTGAIWEVPQTVRFSSALTLTNAQKLAEVKAAYTALVARLNSDVAKELNFWGQEGDV